ncbi:hypothetical protein AB4037_00240 [Labrys sp. KB_33_2]|uniref:hypothetical protein n=1 Tax=Labrys sp. KB_33_2 TaxID=3237479 RepID=UPI003F8F3A47
MGEDVTGTGTRPKIAPSSAVSLPPRGPDWFEFDYAVSSDGRLICLDTSHDIARQGRESFLKSAPTLGRLSIFDGERQTEPAHFPMPSNTCNATAKARSGADIGTRVLSPIAPGAVAAPVWRPAA